MQTIRILATVLGALALLGTADASAARRRDRHAGHQPRSSIATYTVPTRHTARVLRTVQVRPARHRRFAQAPRPHPLMRGS